jgi:UDP-glucuronate 4-epimerase
MMMMMMMMMRIRAVQGPVLVTGAAGFIGFHTAERLLVEGHAVVGLDNLNAYYDPALKEARLARLRRHPNFQFVKVDLRDQAGVDAVFREGAYGTPFTTVIHLAAQAGVRHSLTHPHDYVMANVLGTLHILEGCRYHPAGFGGPPHLVFASTSSVYGLDRRIPFREGHGAAHPITVYAATKLATEDMAHSYAHLFRVPCTGLRFFTVYGPWGRPDMALFRFTRAMLAGEPIEVYGHGAQARDFTYVDDIVDGILGAAASPPEGGGMVPPEAETAAAALAGPPATTIATGARREVRWHADAPDPATSSAPWRILNIGATRKVPLLRFIEVLEQELGVEAHKIMLPMQPGDVPETHADTSRLARVAGYAPSTSVEKGVARFVDWYRTFYGI